jgi:hypothetical protein
MAFSLGNVWHIIITTFMYFACIPMPLDLTCRVDLHLSGLIGTPILPDAKKIRIIGYWQFEVRLLLLLLQSALQPLVGFRPAQLSLSILSRNVLLSAVASGTSNPQLEGEPGI